MKVYCIKCRKKMEMVDQEIIGSGKFVKGRCSECGCVMFKRKD